MAELLRQFEVDEGKMQVLAECMDAYGVGEAGAEWPNNVLSTQAVVYGNGTIARRGEPVVFATDPDELRLCEQLSREAKAVVGDLEVGMFSEANDVFHPFFIAADEAIAVPTKIDEALIRARFGGTIFPLATVTVEALREEGVWWSEVASYFEDEGAEDEEREEYRERWLALLAWFHERPEFVDTAFVRVSDYGLDDRKLLGMDESESPPGTEMAGSVLPRMALGLTRGGSLCGLFGWSVQT